MNPLDYLNALHNHIDITEVPFSDRGSRLLLFRYAEQPALYIKLAERLTRLDPGTESYFKRLPFITGLMLIDAHRATLDFETITDPYQLTLKTRLGDFQIVFQNLQTLAFGFPQGVACGLRFHVDPLYLHTFDDGGKIMSLRDLTYRTNGVFVVNSITPEADGFSVELILEAGSSNTLTLAIPPDVDNFSLVRPFSALREEAIQRWLDWFAAEPEVHPRYFETYAYAWWVMGNNLISPKGYIRYETMTPSKIGYVGLWLWDSALHALAFRHVDAVLARNQLLAMVAHQLPNGMLPDAVYDEGIVTRIDHPFQGIVTKPPIFAWAALKLHQTAPDLDFLAELYPHLILENEWWLTYNDDDHDGLAQYNHPYSSGLDDSPLWDQGMPVESPELNTYLVLQMQSLAEIAQALNRVEEAGKWRSRASRLVALMMDHFWDEKAGLFWVLKDHQPVKVVTPFNLYPLWTAQLPAKIQQKLMRHLQDPRQFWGKFMLPTVARNDASFDPQTMWRGPVWANVNYFFIEALQKIGRKDLADILCNRTLEMIMAQKGMFEFYDPETGIPPASAVRTFGWTAAVFIDLAIQRSREVQS